MKWNTNQLRGKIPVSAHSIIRYPLSDADFPRPEKIGRQSYFDHDAFYKWLESRADCENAVAPGDKIIDVETTCKLLGRSKAWVWLNIVKPNELTKIDLSPAGNSKNPRNYFIEREILEAFPQLIDLTEQRAAA